MVTTDANEADGASRPLSRRGFVVIVTAIVVAACGVFVQEVGRSRATSEVAPLAGLRIDVNSASAAELAMLKGVGPTLAQRIVEHRAEHGPFDSIDQLDDVPGIGPGTIERMRASIAVTPTGR